MNQLLMASTPSWLLILQPFPSLEPLSGPHWHNWSSLLVSWPGILMLLPHLVARWHHGQSVQVGSKLQGPPAVAALLPGFFAVTLSLSRCQTI